MAKKLSKGFSVKVVQIVASNTKNRNDKHTELVSLGENLSWADAIELRKANKGSYIHRENKVYPKRAKRVKKLVETEVV